MKTIRISELKVGDKFPDELKGQYGRYVDFEVSNIRVTKSGRYVIKIDRTYENENGIKSQRQFGMRYSNGAIKGTSFVTIYTSQDLERTAIRNVRNKAQN